MNLKKIYNPVVFFLALSISSCFSQERTSSKTFPAISLVNKIEFVNNESDQKKFCCAFLLKHNNQTYAVTAKHLLKVIKPEGMKVLQLSGFVKEWSMYPLNYPDKIIKVDKLLNENNKERLEDKSTYENDWLLFSISDNKTDVSPLQIRATPLNTGEKLYVVGWTRKMESGGQRVYEFEYYKTIGNRILLKELIVPEQFGGLSGAPLVDEQGLVVGIVSNGTVDPADGKKYFSPCSIQSLVPFLEGQR